MICSFGLGVVVAVGDRFRREAGEDHRMRGADPGTGQHGDRQFRDHRHVDRDHVALPDPQALQDVGKLADFGVQLAVGQRQLVATGSPSQMIAG